MKRLSSRERMMVTLLPAGLILLCYGFFVAKPALAEETELRRQSEVLQERQPPQAKRAQVMRERMNLRGAVQQMHKSQEGPAETVAVRRNLIEARLAEAHFEALLASHGLILMTEARAPDRDSGAFRRALASQPHGGLWSLELAGSYEHVMAFLEALGETQLPLLPIAVEMDAEMQGETDLRRWNLWISR